MTTAAGTHRIGPDNGTLHLHTTRQGLGAAVGHDLTIEISRWSGTVTTGGSAADGALDVTADLDSLRVVSGSGGVKPLSDRDKREIVATATKVLGVRTEPQAHFVSASVAASGDGAAVQGSLKLNGSEQALRLEVTPLGGDRYRATGTVVQTQYGIKPYSGFFGALKLADDVSVEAEVDLSAG
jgi:polyisoprenoid-binding protein YceI